MTSLQLACVVPAHKSFRSLEKEMVDISGDDENVFSLSIFINS